MCICFFYSYFPSIFNNFFYLFDLVCWGHITTRYPVGATSPRVFHRSVLNFTYLCYMVCRCACRFWGFSWPEDVHLFFFLVIFPVFFNNFFYLFDLVCWGHITTRYLVGATSPRVFHRSVLNYTYLCYMVCRCACRFWGYPLTIFINFFYFFHLSFFRFSYKCTIRQIPCGRNSS